MTADHNRRRVRTRAAATVAAVAMCVLPAACGKEKTEKTGSEPAEAEPFGPAECASCGMTLRFQPAPRGQLLHRDGTRAYFCSLGDLVQYAAAPSPHGKPKAIWVELMDDKADPTEMKTDARPWALADDASFVLGVPRRGVMGPPVLSYADKASAERATARHRDVKHHTWHKLRPAVLSAAERPHTPAAHKAPAGAATATKKE